MPNFSQSAMAPIFRFLAPLRALWSSSPSPQCTPRIYPISGPPSNLCHSVSHSPIWIIYAYWRSESVFGLLTKYLGSYLCPIQPFSPIEIIYAYLRYESQCILPRFILLGEWAGQRTINRASMSEMLIFVMWHSTITGGVNDVVNKWSPVF